MTEQECVMRECIPFNRYNTAEPATLFIVERRRKAFPKSAGAGEDVYDRVSGNRLACGVGVVRSRFRS
jgi:hypothetical protein